MTSCIFPVGEEYMVSYIAAKRLEKQLSLLYPRQHFSYVFEFRIADHENQVDLAIAIDREEDIQFLKNHFTNTSNQKQLETWLDDCFLLQKTQTAIKSFWLEMDLDGQEQFQLPSIFISLKPQKILFKELKHLIDVLSFYNANAQQIQLLKNCFEALSTEQYIEHIGVMHSRASQKTIRMYIRGFTPSSLLPFLNAIHWTGDQQLLKAQLADNSSIDYISIAIEFTDDWLPTIGIEFHLKKGIAHATSFLATLQKRSFCSEKRAKAIEAILHEKKIKSDKYTYRRSLSHFKLTLGKTENIEAKVYMQLIPSYTSILGF